MRTKPPIKLADEPPFRVGEADLRPASRELIGPNGTTLIEPRPLQVLILLAGRRGEVVGRQELIDRCWDGRIVGDDAVNRAILKLRKIASDAGDSFAIETIAKVGYRLTERSADNEPVASASSSRPPSRRLLVRGAATAAVAVLGGAGLALVGRRRKSRPAEVQALYDRGEAAFQQGSRDDNAQAVAFFQQAAAKAPEDAQVIGALALALRFEQAFVDPRELDSATATAEAMIRRCLAIDSGDRDGLTAQALYVPFRNHWIETGEQLRAGLARLPDSGLLHGFYGKLLAAVGRTHAALEQFQVATLNERYVPILREDLIHALFAADRVVEADHAINEAVSLWPHFVGLWWQRFWLYALTGREAEALAHAETRARAPSEIGPEELEIARSAVKALSAGQAADIDAALARQQVYLKQNHGFLRDAINFAASVNRFDTAFALLDLYVAPYNRPVGQRLPGTAFLFGAPLRSMRKDHRFARLLQAIGMEPYWRATRTKPDFV